MQGIIEYHGAKQVLHNTAQQIDSDQFIPGDEVVLENGKSHLLKRQEQAVIGIVSKIQTKATLYVPNFGLTCRFTPQIENNQYQIGTRLVLWLHKDGQIEVKGNYPESAFYDAAIITHMYGLTREQPPAIEHQGPNLYTIDEVVNHDDLDTFTIDPATSKDFDDAITVDPVNRIVYVHIVDIANQELTEADQRRLKERCLTLYLSNEHTEHLIEDVDALSLVVGKKRKVITVKVTLDEGGLVANYDIYKSTIVVKNRYNYDNVPANPQIQFLIDLTKQRSSNVNYNINLPSIRVLSDNQGIPESVKSESTNDINHSLVATAMILANLMVSKHLQTKQVKLPNRFHDSLRGFKEPQFNQTGNDHVDSFIMVKRYARAHYSIDEKGHFGLGLTDYVHFTSPMRRYADVLVHKILAGVSIDNLESQIKWLNHRASVVRAAQDIYINWKVMRWLQSNDEPRQIWVTGVSNSGILWFMPSFSLNGFIHVSNLEPKQYWKYDQAKEQLQGQTTIGIGAQLLVDIAQIDSIKSQVALKMR